MIFFSLTFLYSNWQKIWRPSLHLQKWWVKMKDKNSISFFLTAILTPLAFLLCHHVFHLNAVLFVTVHCWYWQRASIYFQDIHQPAHLIIYIQLLICIHHSCYMGCRIQTELKVKASLSCPSNFIWLLGSLMMSFLSLKSTSLLF